jgi:putative addiction module component (TIGR02574 family)
MYTSNAAARVTAVLQEALGLSAEERAEIAAELLSSLDDPAEAGVEAAWIEEIERRAVRAASGESPGISREDARARVARRLSNP